MFLNEFHVYSQCDSIEHIKLERTHRVQTSANAVLYPKAYTCSTSPKHVSLNIHPQLFQFV